MDNVIKFGRGDAKESATQEVYGDPEINTAFNETFDTFWSRFCKRPPDDDDEAAPAEKPMAGFVVVVWTEDGSVCTAYGLGEKSTLPVAMLPYITKDILVARMAEGE